MILHKRKQTISGNNNLMHSLMCFTRLFGKGWKHLNSLKEDLNSKSSTLGSNTSSERGQSSYHSLTKEIPTKHKENFENKQEKLKERKLN